MYKTTKLLFTLIISMNANFVQSALDPLGVVMVAGVIGLKGYECYQRRIPNQVFCKQVGNFIKYLDLEKSHVIGIMKEPLTKDIVDDLSFKISCLEDCRLMWQRRLRWRAYFLWKSSDRECFRHLNDTLHVSQIGLPFQDQAVRFPSKDRLMADLEALDLKYFFEKSDILKIVDEKLNLLQVVQAVDAAIEGFNNYQDSLKLNPQLKRFSRFMMARRRGEILEILTRSDPVALEELRDYGICKKY